MFKSIFRVFVLETIFDIFGQFDYLKVILVTILF